MHLSEELILSTMVRPDNLDSAGAFIRIQVFQKDSSGVESFAGNVSSAKVTGTSDWQSVSLSLVPSTLLATGHTFSRLEIVLMLASVSGSVDFDSVVMFYPTNQALNGDFESFSTSLPEKWIKRTSNGASGTVEKRTPGANESSAAVRLTLTSSSGNVSLVQPKWHNPALKDTGIVATHMTDFFRVSAMVKPTGLTGTALIRVQIFQKNEDGSNAFVAGVSSESITGTEDWTLLSLSFRAQDYIAPDAELGYIEIVQMVSSSSGYADFDEVSFTRDF